MMKRFFVALMAVIVFAMVLVGCGNSPSTELNQVKQTATQQVKNVAQTGLKKLTPQSKKAIREDGTYTDKASVALYLHTYHKLPSNFITKKAAQRLGWKHQGTLNKVAPGKSIGGDRFGNYDGKLPREDGRSWKECDIDYHKGNRGAKRLVFSNDGLIYYTDDHYKSFTRLY